MTEEDATVPDVPKEPVSAALARATASQPSELTETPPAPTETNGGVIVTRFLTYHPFLRLFCHVAHIQYSQNFKPETRVAKLRECHPKFYGLCITLDVILVLVATCFIFTAAVVTGYKTLWL